MKTKIGGLLTLCALLMSPVYALADGPFITVASTTSTQNSGLFKSILPLFTQQSGIEVRVVAVGTGQAIRQARNGDADVLFVHHKPSEDKFVADGFGVKRFDVMYNDFVLIGPEADPAGVKDMEDIVGALKRIKDTQSVFVSRGDDSGTNKKELGLWQEAGVSVKDNSGSWYRETGSGMGATLNAAAGMSAYTLSDRGTWLSFKNKQGITLLSEGDLRLFNPYGVILVNPSRHAHVKAGEGQRFIDWLISDAGQKAISAFQIDGKQLFFPNAKSMSGS